MSSGGGRDLDRARHFDGPGEEDPHTHEEGRQEGENPCGQRPATGHRGRDAGDAEGGHGLLAVRG